MTDDRSERYALTGALSVTTGALLQRLHVAAAGPATCVAQARRSAGACSALVARLLEVERDSSLWQSSLPVIDAARTELTVAAEMWKRVEDSAAREIEQTLVQLLGYVDSLGEPVLHRLSVGHVEHVD